MNAHQTGSVNITDITTLSLFEIERLQLGVRRVYSIPGSSPAKMSSNFCAVITAAWTCITKEPRL